MARRDSHYDDGLREDGEGLEEGRALRIDAGSGRSSRARNARPREKGLRGRSMPGLFVAANVVLTLGWGAWLMWRKR